MRARPAVGARRHLAMLAAAASLAAVLAACGSTASPTPAPTASPTGDLGTRITYQVDGSDGSPAPADLVAATRATLEARARVIDSNATVVLGADGRIVLESNGPISPEARRAFLAMGAVVVAPLPVDRFGTGTEPGAESLQPGDLLPSGLEPLLRASDIDPAGVALLPESEGGPGVALRLTPAGTAALAAWSADHVGDFLAIAVDNRVVSVPVLQAAIDGGEMMISTTGAGWPTEDDLAVFRGAFPAQVIVSEGSIERIPAP